MLVVPFSSPFPVFLCVHSPCHLIFARFSQIKYHPLLYLDGGEASALTSINKEEGEEWGGEEGEKRTGGEDKREGSGEEWEEGEGKEEEKGRVLGSYSLLYLDGNDRRN